MNQTQNYDTNHAAYDAGVFTLTEATVGQRLDGLFPRHQLSLEGLDGGTFVVTVLLPGEVAYRAYHTDTLTQTSIVLVEATLVSAIRVTISGAGGSAAPVLTHTMRPEAGVV